MFGFTVGLNFSFIFIYFLSSGPHLAQQTLDKSLFEASSNKSGGHCTPRPSDISQAPATPENQSNSITNSTSGNLSSTQGGSQPTTQPQQTQQQQQQQAQTTSSSTTSSSGTSNSGTASTTSSQSANNNSDDANKGELMKKQNKPYYHNYLCVMPTLNLG